MLEKRFVEADLHDSALAAPLKLAPASEGESELAPEVVSHVTRLLETTVGDRARRGGFTIDTTIDPALQAEARQAVRKNLDRYAERQKLEPPFTSTKRRMFGLPFEGTPRPYHAYTGKVVRLDDKAGSIDVAVGSAVGRVSLTHEERFNPKRLPPSEFTKEGALLRVSLNATPEGNEPAPARLELGPEGALVAIDPRSRQVLALVGSYAAAAGSLDRASRAQRQPGSAFKPFVYSYALHARHHTAATLFDLPASKDGKLSERRISLRTAIAKSDNAAAERLLGEVGAENVVQWAKSLGIESRLEATPSLALGAYEVTPLELANAYATFASGGELGAPILITKIVGPDGQEVALPQAPPARRVMEADEAYLTTSLLRSVVKDGTAKGATILGRPVAGKTGTTNEAKDAWFVGYSTDVVCSTWVGFDDALPLGWGESGATTALPAWIAFMKDAHDKRPAADFARPASVVIRAHRPGHGARGSSRTRGRVRRGVPGRNGAHRSGAGGRRCGRRRHERSRRCGRRGRRARGSARGLPRARAPAGEGRGGRSAAGPEPRAAAVLSQFVASRQVRGCTLSAPMANPRRAAWGAEPKRAITLVASA